jgi:hypothetical protein
MEEARRGLVKYEIQNEIILVEDIQTPETV